MELRTSFDLLSEVIASFEAAWGDVLHVETSTGADSATLEGTLELPLGYCGVGGDGTGRGLTPDDVEFRDDGGLVLSFAADDFGARAPSTPAGVTTTWEDARLDDEAGIVVSVRFEIRPAEDATNPASPTVQNPATPTEPAVGQVPRDEEIDPEADDGSSPDGRDDEPPRDAPGEESPRNGSGANPADDPLAKIRDEDVPPFEDRPYLRKLYDSCDNFGEMSEIIEMDVSGETVRRYMIEAGVHTPDSYETREDQPSDDGENRFDEVATSGEDESVANGEGGSVPNVDIDPDRFGLPRDMTIEETIDAVVDSRSLHEVTRHLDIDHDQARALLRELDLLDFVSHRLVDAPESAPTYEEVASRIRRSSPQTV